MQRGSGVLPSSNLYCQLLLFQSVSTIFFDTTGNKDKTFEFNQTYRDWNDTHARDYVALDRYVATYEAESDPFGAGYYLSISLGAILLMFQAVDISFTVIPVAWLGMIRYARNVVTPAGYSAEAAQKKAAFFKVSKMIDNAISIHSGGTVFSSLKQSSKSSKARERPGHSLQSVAKFQLLQDSETEMVGGVFWAWEKIFNGSIFAEEGIWFHSRLLVCNLVLFLVAIIIVYLAYLGYANGDKFAYSESQTVAEQAQNLFDDGLSDTLDCVNYNFGPVPVAWSASVLYTFYQTPYSDNNFAKKIEELTVEVIEGCWTNVRQGD